MIIGVDVLHLVGLMLGVNLLLELHQLRLRLLLCFRDCHFQRPDQLHHLQFCGGTGGFRASRKAGLPDYMPLRYTLAERQSEKETEVNRQEG